MLLPESTRLTLVIDILSVNLSGVAVVHRLLQPMIVLPQNQLFFWSGRPMASLIHNLGRWQQTLPPLHGKRELLFSDGEPSRL